MADGVMSGPMDENTMKHMEMTPARISSHADSVRATKIAVELKQAIAKYQDTAAAVADGYKMFLPNVKTPLFGPESPIATKAECDAVRGNFHETVFGWMLHANVYEGRDLGGIFSDDHGPGHKM